MADPLLDVDAATVRFGERKALDALHLEVERGEVVAVLGPSGSGKTTLLRAIAGLQPLDAGRIALEGRDQRGVPPHRRGVGLMFQDHALFPHRDVAGNIGFGLRMQALPRPVIEARVAELLELVGLEGAGGRAVSTLSGGEQQRVALARALAPRPQVLLLDEPLGSLDRGLRERLVRELRELFVSLGQTVVAVTHDHDEAIAMADRVAVVDAGRVLAVGAPETLWGSPRSARVARLLGATNVVRDGDERVLVPPEAVRLDPDGPVRGTVVGRAFTAGRVRLVVRCRLSDTGRDHDLELLAPPDEAPQVGAGVRIALDPARFVALDE